MDHTEWCNVCVRSILSCDKVEHMQLVPLCGVHNLNKISDGMIISVRFSNFKTQWQISNTYVQIDFQEIEVLGMR